MDAEISLLSPAEYEAALDELAAVLHDCVAGGAGVNFLHPFSMEGARGFFRKITTEVRDEELLVFAARMNGRIVGMVHLGFAPHPNQQHRAEVKKLLLHRSARGQGIATRLMARLEAEARARGRTLLVLDTCQGSEAEQLYRRNGWTELGAVPNYALWPDGAPCAAVFFWKVLS